VQGVENTYKFSADLGQLVRNLYTSIKNLSDKSLEKTKNSKQSDVWIFMARTVRILQRLGLPTYELLKLSNRTMQMNRCKALSFATLSLMLGTAHAVPGSYTITQTETITESFSNFSTSPSQTTFTYNGTTPLIATINPFSSYNTGSGTLNTVEIQWRIAVSFTGTTAASFSGSGGFTGSGGAFVGPDAYSGAGGGGGNGAGPNSPFTITASWGSAADKVFNLPWPGGYSPDIAAKFTGASPYTVAFGDQFGNSPVGSGFGNFQYDDIASGLLSMQAQVTVLYNYFGEPVSAPVPATAALLGFGLLGVAASRRKPGRGLISRIC
jgi:hypothetical protein